MASRILTAVLEAGLTIFAGLMLVVFTVLDTVLHVEHIVFGRKDSACLWCECGW